MCPQSIPTSGDSLCSEGVPQNNKQYGTIECRLGKYWRVRRRRTNGIEETFMVRRELHARRPCPRSSRKGGKPSAISILSCIMCIILPVARREGSTSRTVITYPHLFVPACGPCNSCKLGFRPSPQRQICHPPAVTPTNRAIRYKWDISW